MASAISFADNNSGFQAGIINGLVYIEWRAMLFKAIYGHIRKELI
jgi:hypothetical protein